MHQKIGACTAIIINGVIRSGAGSNRKKSHGRQSCGIAGSHLVWITLSWLN
jgi:hypothetical protein